MKELTRKIPIALLAAVMALAFVSFAQWDGGIGEPAFAEDGVEYDADDRDTYTLPNVDSPVPTLWAKTGEEWIQVQTTNVEVVQQDPREAGTDVVRPYFDNENNEYRYDVLNLGEAQLKVSYERLDGQTDSYILTVHCVDSVYSITSQTMNNKYKGLPGEEFTIVSKVEKQYATKVDGQWEYNTTSEGLSAETTLGDGSEYATLDTSGDNPVVKFNDLPEGEDSIEQAVVVITNVVDKNATGTLPGQTEHSFELYVLDSYSQIEPTCLSNPDLPVGQTETFQPKARHYSLANPEGTDIDNVTFYWDNPEDTASELKCENGICSIKRYDWWEQTHRLMAEFDNGDYVDVLYVDYQLNPVGECAHENLITKAARLPRQARPGGDPRAAGNARPPTHRSHHAPPGALPEPGMVRRRSRGNDDEIK